MCHYTVPVSILFFLLFFSKIEFYPFFVSKDPDSISIQHQRAEMMVLHAFIFLLADRVLVLSVLMYTNILTLRLYTHIYPL